MSTPVFPRPAPTNFFGWRGVMWEVDKEPEFRTLIQTADDGREARVSTRSRPRWHFTLHWALLKDDMGKARNASRTYPRDELQTYFSFLLSRLGAFEPFLIRDDTDYRTTDEIFDGSVSAEAGTDFPLVRSFGPGGFVEPVGALDTDDPVSIYINGVPTIAYTPNVPFDGWIRFDSPPGTGSTLSWSGSYQFKVRFEKDSQTLRTFGRDFWEAQKVDLISCYP